VSALRHDILHGIFARKKSASPMVKWFSARHFALLDACQCYYLQAAPFSHSLCQRSADREFFEMDLSAHVAAVLGYFPFIATAPAAAAVVCNRIDAAKRHPTIVYSSCGLFALGSSLLLSARLTKGQPFSGVDCSIAGVLAALCFLLTYLRVANVVTKKAAALLWRELFLFAFAGVCVLFAWGNWKSWGYVLIAVLCVMSAVLLWRSSPLSKYPLYAVTLYLAGGALYGGIYNYFPNPALLSTPIKLQIIEWLIPGVPSVLLINCCLYARRMARDERRLDG
jgi:hypothetical protein